MERIDTLVVGAGHSGLAMSRCLAERGIEHAVLERGRVAERWRSASWDSLRLLTPRWLARLPGWRYEGEDPDGYMHHRELIRWLEGYRKASGTEVREGVEVTGVRSWGGRFAVSTSRGGWLADRVVVATGDCQRALRPAFARHLAPDVFQTDATRYRNPSMLPEGGVLVVGAAATGVQLAAELADAGRAVTLSAGRHTRVPRSWRGRDILWWLDRMGVLDERADEVPDLAASRGQPSLQLVGAPDGCSLDLATLVARGVRLVGRAVSGSGAVVHLEDDLVEHVVAADVKLRRLLARVDAWARHTGLADTLPEPEPLAPGPLVTAPERLDLRAEGIRSVVWATGFRRSYDWLEVPALDRAGEIVHRGGIAEVPGLYVLGLRFLRRRKSSFLDGAGSDAPELADHIAEVRTTGSPRRPSARPRARAAGVALRA